MPTALQLTTLLKELKRTILEEAYSWQYDSYAEEHWDGGTSPSGAGHSHVPDLLPSPVLLLDLVLQTPDLTPGPASKLIGQ